MRAEQTDRGCFAPASRSRLTADLATAADDLRISRAAAGRDLRSRSLVVQLNTRVAVALLCCNAWLSSTLGAVGDEAVEIAKKQQRRRDWWISIKPALSPSAGSLLLSTPSTVEC